MPTEQEIILDYFKEVQLETLHYLMFVLNTSNSIEEVKKVVQIRIDELSK